MSERVKQAIDYCKKHNQGHLSEYLKPVFSEKADQLARQILKTDFIQINGLYQNIQTGENQTKDTKDFDLTPMDCFDKSKASASQIEKLTTMGLESIRKGLVAAITMAGGQGTRLGHKGPKGAFVLQTTPPSSLFSIQCKRLMEIQSLTGVFIPWLIMTSEENHKETVEYFESNQYFGYDSFKVRFFSQEMIPIIDFDGKILVNESGLACGPNGNGGIFSSLVKSGMFDWLKEQGIERVFVCGVDNALVRVADPAFVGFSIQSEAAIACKSVLKRSYDEKAGVFCHKNGKPSYVEYTEISMEQAKAMNEKGEYLFGDVGIVAYVFHMDILARIASFPLEYHIARKKSSYVLPDGQKINPEQPNCIKFESFIFDSFQMTDEIALLRVSREEEFAPVKNSEGEDSPLTASELYKAQHNNS